MPESVLEIENLDVDNSVSADFWKVEPSRAARNTKNSIREIVENLDLAPNPEKSVIALSIGDPTVYGNLKPSEATIEAIVRAIKSGDCNGYFPTIGSEEARKAVAEYLSFDGVQYEARDISLYSGCSAALDACITTLADPGKHHNILIPRPGFPLYKVLAENLGIEAKYYNLIPEDNWMVDLDHLEDLIDRQTAAIILNNPSNPSGCVYSKEHIKEILDLAYRHKIPVIVDEIYERLVFPGCKFVSAATVGSQTPLLICGGLSKRFLVPGWRVGWISIYDPIGALDPDFRQCLTNISQKTTQNCSSIVQKAIPSILKDTPRSYHENLCLTLYENAKLAFECLQKANGLVPFMPQGTMYMMVKIELEYFPKFKSDLDFVKKLMEEESVFCLPGEAFNFPGFIRLVITVPDDLMQKACSRIVQFCNKHCTKSVNLICDQ